MRHIRFLCVFLKAGLFFGLLLGVLAGWLPGAIMAALFPRSWVTSLPLVELLALTFAVCGVVFGLFIAFADHWITRGIPEDRLDPCGAVRQRVTLEVPRSPEETLETVSRIAFEDLQWPIEERAEGHLTLRAPKSFRSFGEQVSVDLHPTPDGTAVLLYSRPLSLVIVFDYNKNRENVLNLRQAIIDRC